MWKLLLFLLLTWNFQKKTGLVIFFITSCLLSPRVCFASHPSNTGAHLHHVRMVSGENSRPAALDVFSCLLWQIVKPPPSTEQLGEDIPKEPIKEAKDSVGSGLASQSQSRELEESGASAPLPRPMDSAEELAKLRPCLDPRLWPSPG